MNRSRSAFSADVRQAGFQQSSESENQEIRLLYSCLNALRRPALSVAAALLSVACAVSAGEKPLEVFGNKKTLEIAPVLLAVERMYPGKTSVRMGGIANLFGEPGVPGLSEPGIADVATHAETQALRYSVKNPDLRIIMTVSEGFYRIVARKSAGISELSDLRGKRIATIPSTSSAFYLHRMLKSVDLKEADVSIVRISPLSGLANALVKGEVDAVTIWEPEIENAAAALGDDMIEFSDHSGYRELFNLNTTKANLEDPAMRKEIVRFVKAVVEASRQIRNDAGVAIPLVAAASGYDQDLLTRSWRHQGYFGNLAPDLLNVLVEEEVWLAGLEGRPPRPRSQLRQLIDPSVLKEALATP